MEQQYLEIINITLEKGKEIMSYQPENDQFRDNEACLQCLF